MFFWRGAEVAPLGVAIGATEVAFLRDRGRKGAGRRRLERLFVDERLAAEADPPQELVEGPVVAARHRGVKASKKLRPGVEQPDSVGDEQTPAEGRLDQMGLRRPRRRGADHPARVREAHSLSRPPT